MFRNGTVAFIFALSLAVPALAGWQNEISNADAARLEKIAEARTQGLAEAQGASPGDAAIIRSIMDARAVRASSAALTGNWRCRLMKLGGATPAIVYTWFTCRIAVKDGALTLEKVTGTLRTFGTLYPDDGVFVYLGAQSVKDEPRHFYSGNAAQAGAAATPDDQIGVLAQLSDGRLRLEMPYPVSGESTFDVIELLR